MGVYKRGDTWWLTYQVGGKQIRESSRSKNRRTAENILSKRKAESLEGRWNLPRSHSPKLQEWADEVIAKIVHKNTKDRYSVSAKNLIAVLGNPKLSEISGEMVEQFQNLRIQQGKHPATVNRDTALLSRLLKLARRRRLTLHNACDDVERLNERRQRRQARPLTYEEESRLLTQCDPLLATLVILLIETGLRSKTEALPLLWSDVDLETYPGSILVRKSKTPAGSRRVALTEYCRGQLVKWRQFLAPEPSLFVFPSPRDPRKHWVSYQDAWRRAVKAAGIEGRRVYDLRSTFATRANAAHATSLTLAHMLGHSSTTILPTYVKALDANMRAVIASLDQMREWNSREWRTVMQ